MIDGALLIDKPVGMSSNLVLQRARKLLGAKKAGHAGTLDPLASGLLIALFGEATKFAGLLLESDKEYLATLKLGETTSTADAEGELLQSRPVAVTERQVREALDRFQGDIQQVPPMHSALKREGVPLYKLARRGKSVERKARSIRVLRLELLAFRIPFADIRVRCSKGTYVRTLAEDIGAALGTGAHLSALRRTASGRFRVEDAISLDKLTADRLLPLAAIVGDLPRVDLDAALAAKLRNGQALQLEAVSEGVAAIFGPGGALLGLGRAHDGTLRPLRLTQAPEKG